MSLIKITFDNCSVSSKQDADCNHYLVNGQNGVVYGVLGRCQPSVSNSYINFQSGYVQVYGRRVYVESGTKSSVSLDRAANGYIVMKFDLGNNEVTLEKKESTTNFPTLTQEDLTNGGLIYELALAKYTKTTSSLNLVEGWTPDYIEYALPIAKEALNKAEHTHLNILEGLSSLGAWLYDSQDRPLTSVVIDLSGRVTYDSLILVNFEILDYYAMGAMPYILGTFVFTWAQLSYGTSYVAIRNSNNNGSISCAITNLSAIVTEERIEIYVPNVTGRPNHVSVSLIKAVSRA